MQNKMKKIVIFMDIIEILKRIGFQPASDFFVKQYEMKGLLANAAERTVAGLIDVLIYITVFVVFNLYSFFWGWFFATFYWLFRDMLPFFSSGSVGKKIVGLKIVAEKNSANDSLFLQNLLRSAIFLLPVINVLDYFSMFSASHQRLGDMWANTIVVKKKK